MPQTLKAMSRLATAFLVVLASSSLAHAQSWVALTNGNPFPGNASTCLLLTDGTVMCQEEGNNVWHRLVPDVFGSYVNGTWDPLGFAIATMPNGSDTSNVAGTTCAPCIYGPTYYASAVLPDGRVVVFGGEYNTNSSATSPSTPVWTNIGFLYDPVANAWSGQLTETFGTGSIGDAQSVVLPDGRMLVAGVRNANNRNIQAFNPATLTFSPLVPAVTGKADSNNEENWHLLPDGTVLTVDSRIANSFEIFNPATNTWTTPAVGMPVLLADVGGNCSSAEVGPGVMRPDGTMVYFTGAPNQATGIYNTATGTWAAGPTFPNASESVNDGPASLLPNGNVLVQASPACLPTGNPANPFSVFNPPSNFYEFTLGNTLTNVAGNPPNANLLTAYQGRMLLLPTGEVLFTGNDQNGTEVVQIYQPAGGPQDAWRPVIKSAPHSVDPGTSYSISGQQFNGFSEGASYGDDAQMSTNYPLVRITNHATGHVFYARTHDHSRMGIYAVGNTDIVTTQFDTPDNMETGVSDLEVVVNGIASLPFVINGPGLSVPGPVSLEACLGTTASTTLNVCNTGQQNLVINNITSSNPQFSVDPPSSGYSLVISPDFCFPFQLHYTPSAIGTTNASLTIFSNDPNTPQAQVSVTGSSPAPDINATLLSGGSFGNVCAGNQGELVLELLNQGRCNLNITGLSSSNPNFELPSVTSLPLVLSHDAHVSVPIRFKPTGPCSDTTGQNANITVTSNDPVTPNVVVPVSGFQGCPQLVLSPEDLSGTFAFPATVSDPTGHLGCFTDRQLSISNAGSCPLNVASITATSPTNAFTVLTPVGPLSIGPGAGPVPVTVRFKPIVLTGQLPNAPDEQTGTLSIVSNNPVAATADLCGEPTVKSGLRLLVTTGAGVPYNPLDSVTLMSKGLSPGVNLKLTNLVPASKAVCGKPPILYHVDNETLFPAGTTGANPKASYQLSVKAGGKPSSMSFTLGQCEMKEMVVQIK